VLVAEHHHRNQASAVPLVVDKFSPAVVTHHRAPREPARPVVALRRAVLVLQQQRHDYWLTVSELMIDSFYQR
jgi:hypothetical protein